MAKLTSGYKFVISEDSRNVELTKHKVARGFAKIVFSNCANSDGEGLGISSALVITRDSGGA